MGLKRCEECSEAAIKRSIWLLFKQASFLWVAWVRNNLLKNQSFWQVKVPQQCSYGWIKILKIQELVRPSINFQVGDGSSMFFYTRMVLCILKYEHHVVCHTASITNAKLSSVISNHSRSWLPARSEDLVSIQCKLPEIVIGDSIQVVWVHTNGCYSCASAREQVRYKDVFHK